MKVGTKSLLFGAHQFILHPVLVAFAWYRLYGFPFDPRLWIAFIVYDWGYWGKADMDGAEGETHVFYLFRTRLIGELYEYMALSANGKYSCKEYMHRSIDRPRSWFDAVKDFTVEFVAKHSRI